MKGIEIVDFVEETEIAGSVWKGIKTVSVVAVVVVVAVADSLERKEVAASIVAAAGLGSSSTVESV